MNLAYDAVLLIAFGGPTCPEEIRPFLARVTAGVPIPPARLDEVAHHYEAVGGKSPLNEIAMRQADALQNALAQRGLALPVYVGMRNSAPFFSETLPCMYADRIKRALGFILSSHRTEASWERYQKNIAETRAALNGRTPEIDYCDGWHDHPLFIQSWVERIQEAQAKAAVGDRAALVFTAHSVPVAMAAQSPYVEQLETSARLIARRLGRADWTIAYQSRSGKPTDPWLEPDIGHVIKDFAASGVHQLLLAPIGFVCDHVEVLYDLDIEAAKIAKDRGLTIKRASCPNDHPTFILMMADVIERKIKSIEDRG
jgi:protoporphyrin/coproporphyrin ferrochelatase